jgi:pimeloyl-ACP methyl ester carboxylesterase
MYFVRIFLLFIFGLLAAFAFLQRQLMYPAMRATSLAVKLFPQLEETFHKATDVELKTPDKVTIRGWHLQANAQVSDRLILLFHGNGGHRAHRSNWYQIARSLEADVLTIDYHGYGDSGGSPSEKALLSDADAAWRYAVDELKYQPSQIVIVGESLGGGVGVQLAAKLCRNKTIPAGLVLSATFPSMLEAASRKFWWLPVRFLLLDRYRSDKHIGDVSCPLLQFHGDQDTLIPLSMGQKLHGLAPAMSFSGKAKQMVILEDAGHNNMLHLHGRLIRDHMATFIR